MPVDRVARGRDVPSHACIAASADSAAPRERRPPNIRERRHPKNGRLTTHLHSVEEAQALQHLVAVRSNEAEGAGAVADHSDAPAHCDPVEP